MSTIPQNHGPNHPPTVTKPHVVLDYNIHKCHVDTVDQLRQYYAMQRKSNKNWPSLAWWLVDMCIINAYTLWCLDTEAVISQLDFRRALWQQIPAAYPPSSTRTQLARPTPLINWPIRSHTPRKCRHCSSGKTGRRRSAIVCKQCNVHLCLGPCFELYHAEE